MTRNRLSSSTAILAALSLAVPHGALAQDAALQPEQCLTFAEEVGLPEGVPLPEGIALPEGCEVLVDAETGLTRPLEEVRAELDEAAVAEAPAEEGPTEEELAAQLAAEQAAAEQVAAEEAAAAEAQAIAEAEAAQAAEQAAAEEAAAAEAQTAEEATAEEAIEDDTAEEIAEAADADLLTEEDLAEALDAEVEETAGLDSGDIEVELDGEEVGELSEVDVIPEGATLEEEELVEEITEPLDEGVAEVLEDAESELPVGEPVVPEADDDPVDPDTVTDIEEDTIADSSAVDDEGVEIEGETPAETVEAPEGDEVAEAAEAPVEDDPEAAPDEEAATPVTPTEEELAAALEAELAAPAEAEVAALEEQIETAVTPEGEVGEVAEVAEVADVSQQDNAVVAEIANAAPAEVAAALDPEAAEVVATEEVVLTEENTQAADEEFAAAPAPEAEDEERFSDFERALLLGLGGLAVGSIVQGIGQGAGTAQVVENTGDRVVLLQDGELVVLKDDDAVIRQPGTTISTQQFADGSTRTVAQREDGGQVVTIRSATGQVLRRTRILPDGTEVILFDDTVAAETVTLEEIERLRAAEAAATARAAVAEDEAETLRQALAAEAALDDRRFTLQQVRNVRAVRNLVPTVELSDVNFALGSAAITAEEAQELAAIGREMVAAIQENPGEVFLIEGHTDATGGAALNLALSDRRAESVARALTQYFGVPPENMVVQGYGESNLLVPTLEAERANRRASVRRITPLLQGASLN